MMRPTALMLTLVVTLPAAAQVALNPDGPGGGGGGEVIVDPGVDSSPRAVSLRVIDPGNGSLSRARIYDRRAGEGAWNPYGLPAWDAGGGAGLAVSHRYEYRAPGVQAFVRRPQWLVTRRGHAPVAGPDTVYNLIPDDVRGAPVADEVAVDDRYDPRLGLNPDPRLDMRVISGEGMRRGRSPMPALNEPMQSVPASIPRLRPRLRPAVEAVEPAATRPADDTPAPPVDAHAPH